MASYSITPTDDHCYPGTTVLINKLDLRDQRLLDQAEEMAAAVGFAQIYDEEYDGPYTFEFYKSLHKRLFGKLYDWAGETRTVNLTKKGTAFCPADELETVASALFKRLAEENEFRDQPHEQFVTKITEFYHDLNMLHPFREGNGRTQRLFFTLLIEHAGYHIDFFSCDPDDLMMGTLFAAQGVQDHLRSFFEKAIKL